MVTLICGGRNYGDYSRFKEVMKHLPFTPSIIVQGGARGADLLAKLWAKENNIHCAEVQALWQNGKSAGHARNSAMLLLGIQYAIALPGGAGTKNMVKQLEASGVTVWQPFYGETSE